MLQALYRRVVYSKIMVVIGLSVCADMQGLRQAVSSIPGLPSRLQ